MARRVSEPRNVFGMRSMGPRMSATAKRDAPATHLIEPRSRPAIREISEVSGAVRGLLEGYRIHRVYFPAEIKDEIQKLYRP